MIRLLRCDALRLGEHVAAGSVELAYLDPPFAIGADLAARTRKGEGRGRVSRTTGPTAYRDRWPSLEAYLAWLAPRLDVVRSLLGPSGTMWLHLDQRAVHEAKAVCDLVFGARAFLGEVVWVPGNGSKSRRGPGIAHQTLLLYTRGTGFIWNHGDPVLREPYAETSMRTHFRRVDASGRRYRERVIGGKAYRYFADEGRALGSVWTDCPAMVANTPLCSEATGYPTQKPLKLLERIVRASSRPEGLVLDPFCGSGTTLHAAALAGRDAVGADIGALAVRTATRRLRQAGFEPSRRRPQRS